MLGANVVRIHLQFGKFMNSPTEPNAENLDRLRRLVLFAESQGLYLDITGLGSYRKRDVPRWYDELDEARPLVRAGEFLGSDRENPRRPPRRLLLRPRQRAGHPRRKDGRAGSTPSRWPAFITFSTSSSTPPAATRTTSPASGRAK